MPVKLTLFTSSHVQTCYLTRLLFVCKPCPEPRPCRFRWVIYLFFFKWFKWRIRLKLFSTLSCIIKLKKQFLVFKWIYYVFHSIDLAKESGVIIVFDISKVNAVSNGDETWSVLSCTTKLFFVVVVTKYTYKSCCRTTKKLLASL